MPRNRLTSKQYYTSHPATNLIADDVINPSGIMDYSNQHQPYFYNLNPAQPHVEYVGNHYNNVAYIPQQNPLFGQWSPAIPIIPICNTNYLVPVEVSTSGPDSSISTSIFSPDAPEFVSRLQNSSSALNQNSVLPEEGKKKKTKKKKKKNGLITHNNQSETPMELDSASPPTSSSMNIISGCKNKVDPPPISSNPPPVSQNVNFSGSKLVPKQYSILVRNPTPNHQSTTSATDKNERSTWPGLEETKAKVTVSSKLTNSSPTKLKMSFADKLKNANSTKSPFLDWRDQRTGIVDSLPIAQVPVEKEDPPLSSLELKEAENHDSDDGFTQVVRKKTNKAAAVPQIPKPTAPIVLKTALLTEEEVAKKKAEKERKKLREKEKKKRLREDKLLAQKLMPKSQKIGFITPQVMKKFQQSLQNPKSSGNQSIFKLDDQELFPSLKAGGSESDWETTEVKVTQPNKPTIVVPMPSAAAKNVKRSDPIQFDLLALIARKSNKKTTTLSKMDAIKQKKARQGVVANVLDRSAPVLSRGKIRNKKRKLSEIRKALLAAKAKKKLQNLSLPPAPSVRPHQLHSKKFREYCDQILTDNIDQLARDMLFHLRTFQDRAFKKDPIKGRMKKRLLAGLREVTKQVERRRVKIIFLAPDIQRCPETGGLDEAVEHLLNLARQADLPVVYALSRRKMGRVLCKKVPVSCCGILNYQATEETWKKLTEAVAVAREEYQLKLKQLGLSIPADTSMQVDPPAEPTHPSESTASGMETCETEALLQLMKMSLLEK